MKKAVMVLIIILSIGTMASCQGLEGLNKENVHIYSVRAEENNQQADEYGYAEDNSLQEYEQYVCDQVTPPKMSAGMALCTEIGGRMLIEFIALREAVRRYFIAFKAMIKKWVKSIVA